MVHRPAGAGPRRPSHPAAARAVGSLRQREHQRRCESGGAVAQTLLIDNRAIAAARNSPGGPAASPACRGWPILQRWVLQAPQTRIGRPLLVGPQLSR